jgi:hypothetical protein
MCTTTPSEKKRLKIMKHAKQAKLRPCAHSFLDSLRELLTPAIWKQAEQTRRSHRAPARWKTQPLILTWLVMSWCCGDSQAERFETAKGFTSVCLSKRRRPGSCVQGFQSALAKLPVRVLRVIATGVRRQLLRLVDLSMEGFCVFGCDGSSMETPCVEELEKRLDPRLKKNARSQVWVTALVHLRTGLLWSWRLGLGYNRERAHLRTLLGTLPKAALIVADAGFNGYDLARSITQSDASFLIRMSGKDRLYVTSPVAIEKFRDGEVLLWTQKAQKAEQAPLKVRLIRIRAKHKRDVWLLTDVLDRKRLTVEMAGRYYRWRWENEGLFRTFKRTLAKVRLQSRTIRMIHREAEGALLATQILLAQGARNLGSGSSKYQPSRCSPRKVLLVIRDVILGKIGIRQKARYQKRLAKALREDRKRTSSKVKRDWPVRAQHKPQKPPRFLVMTPAQSALARNLLRMET